MVTIALDRVSVRLGRRAVVEQVSATLTPGSLVGIIGPNGAGKSTLVRAMLGLLPTTAGTIAIDGDPVARMPRAAIARRIAYLPQGQALHWPLEVRRVVALGRLPHMAPLSGLAPADAAAIDRAIARADIAHLAGRTATELSGGERARVLLARALAVEAPALVADEPLAALDPGHQIDVMRLLADEARGGALVVAVLHDLTMAARYCDRLLLMDGGRLMADGAPMEVLSADRLRAVYGIRAMVTESEAGPMIVPLGRAE
ncbi:ABC transporter ATP-binding protein [Sphingomonas naphthae]|uniref:ABC transporter ATP-binding protein n=1 Tax=Sphingomonas naphthae TaxID=1813468 RepID=A0ABY7TPI5_9SPHN|nr:ABC transporter ATP-binding protein [Sphingomonas naphthae]WCT75152.1 ABC transporter ATP-binding protein [Sphingomonas naphthae]